MDAESSTYQLLNAIGQAPLYFLPLLVAMTTANKLKVNPLLAVSAVGTLILPAVTGMLAEGATLLTFNVQAIDYSSQVFPAILTVLFYSVMEKFFTKHSPKAIRVFFVPMISLLLTVPVGLLILGPLGYNVGSLFSSFIVGLYTNFGWIATALLAGILPLMVVTGMHKALLPYAVDQFAKNGYEILYVAASLAHNVSEAGATFAVALKSKDKKLKATAFSAGISALFGITEPALYGVTILHKKVLYSVMVSSFISGAIGGLLMIRGFALVGPGIASVTMFIDPENSMNFVWAMIVFALTFVLSFVSTFFFFKDTEIEEIEESLVTNSINLAAPVKGTIIPLSTVKDEVFSSGMVGAGVGIIPEEGIVYAPEAGEVTMVFGTNHALGMKLANGAELLIHVGIDTVQMNGEGFTSFVKTGDYVEKGQQLLSFEIEKIQAAHLDPTIICVVTNKDDYKINSDDSITKLFSVATI
jgi:PTS system beta-glucosides-specific IIC component